MTKKTKTNVVTKNDIFSKAIRLNISLTKANNHIFGNYSSLGSLREFVKSLDHLPDNLSTEFSWEKQYYDDVVVTGMLVLDTIPKTEEELGIEVAQKEIALKHKEARELVYLELRAKEIGKKLVDK